MKERITLADLPSNIANMYVDCVEDIIKIEKVTTGEDTKYKVRLENDVGDVWEMVGGEWHYQVVYF